MSQMWALALLIIAMDQWYPGSEPIDNAAARGHVSQPRIQTEHWDSFSPQQGPRPNFIT